MPEIDALDGQEPDRALTRREQGLKDIPVVFLPTKAQWRFLNVFLAPDGPDSIAKCAAKACVNRRTVYDWQQDPRFKEWFHDQCEKQAKTERELMWRNARKLAIAGSPEHIKLVAQKAGELIHAGANDRRPIGPLGVFINVPRPDAPQLTTGEQDAGEVDAETVDSQELLDTDHVAAHVAGRTHQSND